MSYKTLQTVMQEANVPVYQCHKKVRALRIKKRNGLTFMFDGIDHPVTVDVGLLGRFTPEVGDYLVIYADDYASFSPKHAFEDGYTKLP